MSPITPRNEPTNAEWKSLAAMCQGLVVLLAVALLLIFRWTTGQNWSITSLGLAFLAVCFLREHLRCWIWGLPASAEGRAGNTPEHRAAKPRSRKK